ncbi:hypothetical protein C9I57_11915 [Trinickia symbiotica]|uniref:Uncharacterized protein n=1 Tax=Trinickia symbiotica TaxID=863227 RepID=A0A2T3XVI4_9BURK|nr:hypothetical protein [Trinickia symbiotica]PTB20539.1 hypothetical protein C9I57_11915 [Trinickia symbiotica]
MGIELGNADIVAIVALALLAALLLAFRFRPTTWLGVALEILLANALAIAAVLAFDVMLS